MRVLIDMDGIVVNLLHKWLQVYNEEWKDNLTVADIPTWHIHKHVNQDCGQAIYDIAKRPHFFDDLEPLPGAIEGVKELQAAGHEVALATACIGPDSARAKLEWANLHLGFGRRQVCVFHNKHWLDADLLIDDSPDNIREWRAKGAPAMTIAYPYNETQRNDVFCYAQSYQDTVRAWHQLVAAVRNLG